jgi:hypothetical protein
MSGVIVQPAPATSTYRRQTPTVWQAVGRGLWRALEEVGRRRAASELLRLAKAWETVDPALARSLREAAAYQDTTTLRENT